MADIIGHIIVPGYSFLSNAISELSESGADGRLLFSLILVSSSLMGIVFGFAMISNFKFKESKPIFLGGVFLTVMAVCTTLTSTIFPMDPVGQESAIPGIMHLVLVGVSVLLIFPALLMIGIGLYKKWRWRSFRNFTIVSVVILLISGGLCPVVIANWEEYMGLIERINVYTYFIWIIVLAILLMKENGREPFEERQPPRKIMNLFWMPSREIQLD